MKLRNPFTAPGKWYKANLHTHTTTSDGVHSPAEAARAYRKAGYHVLALTDHEKTNDVRGLSRKNFLLVTAFEWESRCPGSPRTHHLVSIGIPHGFDFDQPEDERDPNACIAAVESAGGLTFLAHPFWSQHRYDLYTYLRGLVGVEVYNHDCGKVGRSDSEAHWSDLLDAGRILPALAVDDTHNRDYIFGGWVWLRMRSLTAAAVMGALRRGCYYSSAGPKIHDFRVRRGAVELSCSPAAAIYFIGHFSNGAHRRAKPGKSVRKFSHPVSQKWRYVRAVVVDHTGQKAWTNPIIL